MGAPRKFYLFRHGETDWNLHGKSQGQVDIALNETGREQARRLGRALRYFRLDTLVSSDLERALETARLASDGLNLDIQVTDALREAHFGVAQGLTYQEVDERFGRGSVDTWRSGVEGNWDFAFPGGETSNQVLARSFGYLEEFARTRPERCVGVSTHGGVIRRFVQKILAVPGYPTPIPNGVVYLFTFDPGSGRWRIEEKIDWSAAG